MLDYLDFVRTESARFNDVVAAIAATSGGLASARVPSCPDWNAADLAWHLAEVQYFWASIVEGNLSDPADVTPLERPADNQLVALHQAEAMRLQTTLTDHDPDEACWSWYAKGHTVGWVRRRQAHEALVHRIDAELAAATIGVMEISAVDESLAEDGIDEILTVMLHVDELPAGLSYEASDVSIGLATPSRSWAMNLGRVIGETPGGRTLDEEGLRLLDGVAKPTATVNASATDLNLWLWRRTELPADAIDGDEAAAAQLHDIATID
jgi:uncharacterized protein (TIGR03083 family)